MSVNMKQSGNLIPIASLTKAIIPLGFADCYSEEERQVGCFVDGKPLYQKTIYSSGGNLTSGQIGIPNDLENIEHVVNWECVTHDVTHDRDYCLDQNRRDIAEEVKFQIYIPSDHKVYMSILLTGTTFMTAIGDTWVTLQYTKTTDTAGSGIWTPNGTEAVHYTTAEQIIGTYLGNTLYSKTISIPSATMTNGTINIVISADYSNVDKLVSWECNIYDPTAQRNYNIPYIRVTDSESLYLLVHRVSDHTVNAAIFCRGSGYNNRTFQNIEFSLQYTKTA